MFSVCLVVSLYSGVQSWRADALNCYGFIERFCHVLLLGLGRSKPIPHSSLEEVWDSRGMLVVTMRWTWGRLALSSQHFGGTGQSYHDVTFPLFYRNSRQAQGPVVFQREICWHCWSVTFYRPDAVLVSQHYSTEWYYIIHIHMKKQSFTSPMSSTNCEVLHKCPWLNKWCWQRYK